MGARKPREVRRGARPPDPAGGARRVGDSGRLVCPIAEACGGCALINRPYVRQLRHKAERVRRALESHARVAGLRVERCLPAPRRAAYRNRAKLAVRAVRGRVRIGLYRRGTNRLVDLAPCRVQRPAVQEAIERLRAWLAREGLAWPDGPVFYVDLRESVDDGCHVTFVVGRAPPASFERSVDRLASGWPGLQGVAINHGTPDSSFPLGPRTEPLRGPPSFLAPVEGDLGAPVVFEVPATAFFQVAPAALAGVHRRMRTHLGSRGTLYDLYCGVGLHGLLVERGSREADLVGVEESATALDAARRNARRLGVLRARFARGRAEEVVAELFRARPPRRVILNPGRAGCRLALLERVLESDAARIAYLSCEPVTLARDLARLVAGGFRVRRVIPVDLMPQTDHVEALALLERASPRRAAPPARGRRRG